MTKFLINLQHLQQETVCFPAFTNAHFQPTCHPVNEQVLAPHPTQMEITNVFDNAKDKENQKETILKHLFSWGFVLSISYKDLGTISTQFLSAD